MTDEAKTRIPPLDEMAQGIGGGPEIAKSVAGVVTEITDQGEKILETVTEGGEMILLTRSLKADETTTRSLILGETQVMSRGR